MKPGTTHKRLVGGITMHPKLLRALNDDTMDKGTSRQRMYPAVHSWRLGVDVNCYVVGRNVNVTVIDNTCTRRYEFITIMRVSGRKGWM